MRSTNCLTALAAMLLAVSCGPYSYTMSVDVRKAPSTGCDFAGKSLAIAYVTDGNAADSTFLAAVAEGLASGIEADYFDSRTVIPLYTMPYTEGAVYSVKDTMVNLVMDLQSDIVMLLERPDFGELKYRSVLSGNDTLIRATVPFQLRLNLLDSMDKEDTVRTYKALSTYRVSFDDDGKTDTDTLEYRARMAASVPALNGGGQMAAKFSPVWEKQSVIFYYYYTDAWLEASEKLVNCEFKDAMTDYLEFVKKGSREKRASAGYNLALCCYLLKEYDAALAWLDFSDGCSQLPNSSSMRKRILQNK